MKEKCEMEKLEGEDVDGTRKSRAWSGVQWWVQEISRTHLVIIALPHHCLARLLRRMKRC